MGYVYWFDLVNSNVLGCALDNLYISWDISLVYVNF